MKSLNRKSDRLSRIAGATAFLAALLVPVVLGALPAAAIPLAFTAADVSTTANGAEGIAVADLDGDGDRDLVSTSFVGDTLSFHENTAGDGSAWTETDLPGPTNGPISVVAGDLDGDGDLDLASASSIDDRIAWFENTAGDGSAWTLTTIATSADQARSVAVGDLDGDGDLDLASASLTDSTIAWYENTAGNASAWTATDVATDAAGATSVAVGDLDGDGDLDLASSSQNDDTIAWYANTVGDGSAWTATDIATDADGARSVAVGDLDGDGDLDLTSASSLDDTIAWYENTAGNASAWTAADIATTADDAQFVATGDLDADGDIDLASASLMDDTIAWYENTAGDASAWTATDVATGADEARSVATGDLDGDDDVDLASGSFLDDTIAWYENNLPARTTPSWAGDDVSINSDEVTSVAEGDLDGDGDLDLVSAAGNNNTIAWYENTAGDGSAWTKTNVSTVANSVRSVAVGDLDGDGDLDLASANSTDDTISWYENTAGDGSAWTKTNVAATADSARSVAVGDLDADGDLDLASASGTDDTIAWYENTVGDASAWTGADIDTNADAAQAVTVGDLDADGDLDLASASISDDAIAWYENTVGDGSAWTATDISTSGDSPQSITAADLDGDGDFDLAAGIANEDAVAWYENVSGDGSAWGVTNVATTADSIRSVSAGDLDGDGDLDLASGSSMDDTIAWYENTAGDASAWTGTDVSTNADNAQSVTTGDIDGDGDLDLASASQDDDTVAWYEGLPSLSVQDASDPEGDPVGIEVFAGRLHENVTAELSTANGTAIAGTDYTALTDEPVTVSAGTTSEIVEVATTDDNIDEPNKTFNATLADPTGAGIEDASAQATITDDDPTPGISINNVSVTEKDSKDVEVDLTIELTNPRSVDVTVQATTVKDSAKKGDDYTHKDKLLTIPAGSTTKTFTVTVKGDKIDEPEEKFFADLTAPTAAVLDDDRGKVTINDNDAEAKLSVKNVDKREGNSGKKKFTFKVKLNKESGKTITVTFKTKEKSAHSPSDFVKVSKTLTFKPGKTKKDVAVKVKGDKINESTEKFLVRLSKAKKSNLADGKGRGVIRDDD